MGLLLLSAAVTTTAQNIWKTEAVSVKTAGSKTTIELALENTDEVTALQFDLTVPQGMTLDLNSVSLNSSRTDGHSLTKQKQDTTNVYRFLLHNMDNKALKGNSGTLLSLPVTVGEGFKSSTFAMSNVVMTNKKAENLSYSTQFGLVSLLAKQKVILSVSGLEQRVNTEKAAVVSFTTIPVGVASEITPAYYSDRACLQTADETARKKAGTFYATFAYAGCDTLEALNDTVTMIVSNKQNIDFKTEGTVLPEASTIMQGQPLSASILSGGKAFVTTGTGANAKTTPLPGTFAWTNGNEPAMKTGSYSITFSPDDYANYVTKDTVINLTVIPVYQVFVSQPENGSISASGLSSDNRYAEGQRLFLKAVPAANYQFVKWSNEVKTDTTTWEVNGDGTISAVFTPITRKVTIEAGTGGTLSITADGKAVTSGSTLKQGTELNITATPGTGYSLSGLTLNGVAFSSGKYVLGKEDITFKATFAELVNEFPVTATATNGIVRLYKNDGTPIPSGTALPDGTAFKAIPFANAGYELSDLRINSVNVTEEDGVYSGKVDRNTTVSATFAPKEYNLSISATDGGSISVKDATDKELTNGGKVAYNSSVVIDRPMANEGYKLLSLIANGQRIEQFPATLTVGGALSIVATFEELATIKDEYLINAKQTYTYNGQYKSFIIRTSQTHASDFNVLYKKEGTNDAVNGIPINAGTYDLTVTRPADNIYKAYTSGADYFKQKLTIAKSRIAVTVAPTADSEGKRGETTLSDVKIETSTSGDITTFTYIPSDANYESTTYSLSTSNKKVTLATENMLRSTPNGYVRITNGGLPYAAGAEIPVGTTIKVEAVPNDGYKFKEWTGRSETAQSIEVTVSENMNSNFVPVFEGKRTIEPALASASSGYTGLVQVIKLSANIENAQIAIFKDEECTQPAELKNAGTYYVRVYRPATDEVNEINKVLPYTVNPAVPEIVVPTTTDIATGETLAQVQMLGGSAGSVAGTFSWKDSTMVVKNGTHSYTAVFTSSDPNYSSSTEVQVSITGLSATKSDDPGPGPGPGPDPVPDPDPSDPDVPTGIEEIASETLIVVRDGSLVISPCTAVDIAVISMDGKYIFRDKIESVTNVRVPSSGVYVVSFTNGEKRISRKVSVL